MNALNMFLCKPFMLVPVKQLVKQAVRPTLPLIPAYYLAAFPTRLIAKPPVKFLNPLAAKICIWILEPNNVNHRICLNFSK